MSTHHHRRRVGTSGLTVLALSLAAAVVPALPAAAVTNLVGNGGFEQGTTAQWAQYPLGKVTVSASADAPEGEHIATYPASSSLAQTVTGLKSNTRYLVTAELRKDAGVGQFFIGLRYFDGAHAAVVEAEKVYSEGVEWTHAVLPFTTGSAHTQVNILTQNLDAAGPGSAQLDDVRLVELSAARVSIEDDTRRADTIAEADGTAGQWTELQSALAAASSAYSHLDTPDGDVEAAASRLRAAVDAYADPPPTGVVSPGATTYYVSEHGDDGADGLTPETAWRSIEKINVSMFAPGDSILLHGGDSWEGTILAPRGSGTPEAPITLGRYGDGDARPYLNAGDDVILMPIFNLVKGEDPDVVPATQPFSATVYLADEQHWVIRDLDVANHRPEFTDPAGDGTLRSGIMIMNDNSGTLRDIDVVDNYVHDVLGSKSDKTYWGGAGIIYTVMLKAPDVSFGSNYEDILIEGNFVRNTNRQGIVTNSRQNLRLDIDHVGDLATAVESGLSPWFPSEHVVIRDNYVKDVAGDGILPQVTQGALVERNTADGFNQRSGGASVGIWAWNADDTVFQFNESFGGMTLQDGQGYDVDYGQTGTIYQYNYSHDNEGGFMLICSPGQGSKETGPGHGVKTQDAVIRYNVSQNDRARTFMFSGYSDGSLIYNNTIYQGPGINARPIDFWAWNGTYPTSAAFYNNVFHLESAGNWNYTDRDWIVEGFVFDSNTIFGQHTAGEPDDAHKATSDPLLIEPGSGVTNTPVGGSHVPPTLDGYKLHPGSPAIGTGKVIETETGRTFDGKAENAGADLWGAAVVAGVAPNRGADNSHDDSVGVDPRIALGPAEIGLSDLAESGVGIAGSGFDGGATVTLSVGGVDGGSRTATADGDVEFVFTTASLAAGAHRVTLRSAGGDAEATLSVVDDSDPGAQAGGAVSAVSATGPRGGNLALTGGVADIGATVAALTLVVSGLLLWRRRRLAA